MLMIMTHRFNITDFHSPIRCDALMCGCGYMTRKYAPSDGIELGIFRIFSIHIEITHATTWFSMSISDRSMSLRADTTSHLGGIKPSSQCFTTSFSAPSTSQHNRYISSIFSISEVQPECAACAAAPCSTTTTLHMRRTPSTKLWAACGGAMRWISVFFPFFLAVCRPKTSTTQIYTQLSNFRTATWHVDGIYKAHTAHTHTPPLTRQNLLQPTKYRI